MPLIPSKSLDTEEGLTIEVVNTTTNTSPVMLREDEAITKGASSADAYKRLIKR